MTALEHRLAELRAFEYAAAQETWLQLYTIGSDKALFGWLAGLDTARTGEVSSTNHRARSKKSSVKRVLSYMDSGDGLSLIPEPGSAESSLIEQIVVSDRRAGEIRWFSLRFARDLPGSPRQRFVAASELFDEVVDVIAPVYAFLNAYSRSVAVYECFSHQSKFLVPFCGYYWRNYLTPGLGDGLVLGDGVPLEVPRFVDWGELPFVRLAERDRVQQILEPLQTPRRDPPLELLAEAPSRWTLASIDGGLELPEPVV